MRILHIITQKPNSTGSGVYMCGMINGFEKIGYNQAVIAGLNLGDDINCFSEKIPFYPVIYNTDTVPFPVVGMSDSMPYNSTKYRDLSVEMVKKLKLAFKNNIEKAVDEFKPDLIICHHLYLLTAFVREIIKDIKIVGLCHGTCLRQLKTIDLEKDYIISNISNLDIIFALHDRQKEDIIKMFNIREDKVIVIGSGYNDNIFYDKKYKLDNRQINITFAGKICKTKGLDSLIKSISRLNYPKDSIRLNIAGTGSDLKQNEEILNTSKKCSFEIDFLGKLNQNDLCDLFNKSHIFVLPSFYEGLPVVVLEALACGTEVITTDIDGVKHWMGDNINSSGKIEYIKLPKMKRQGIPFKNELNKFEDDLHESLNTRIENILNKYKEKKHVNMDDKTWDGLSLRISKFIEVIANEEKKASVEEC